MGCHTDAIRLGTNFVGCHIGSIVHLIECHTNRTHSWNVTLTGQISWNVTRREHISWHVIMIRGNISWDIAQEGTFPGMSHQ